MKPTKLLKLPWIEPISKRGTLVVDTDVGLMTMHDAAVALGIRPATWYERYRRCKNYASLKQINKKLFGGLDEQRTGKT